METVDLIKGIGDNVKEYQKATDQNVAEIKTIIATHEAKVKELVEDNTKKGATILQLTEDVKDLAADKGRLMEAQDKGKSIIQKLTEVVFDEATKGNIAKAADRKFEEVKFMHQKVVADITSANITARAYESTLSHTMGMQPYGFLPNVRDILRIIPSATDYVQFPRAATPAGEGSFGQQRTEGAAKPQLDYDWSMVDVTLYAMAGYATVSKQSLRNIPFLSEVLPNNMLDDLYRAENQQFGAELYAGATGVTTSTGFTGNPEILIALIRNQMRARYRTSAIYVSPEVWAKLLTFRPGTDNPYSTPPVLSITPGGGVIVLGVPVVPVEWLTGGQTLVGDFSKAGIIESEGLTMAQAEQHSDNFTKNLVTFRIERTEALAIFRPDAFIATALSLS